MVLELQVKLLSIWAATRTVIRSRIDIDDERGEVTAQTAIIVVLVIAAIAAGGVIASKITGNANNVPSP